MNTTLIASLKSIHNASLQWEQEPVVLHEGISVQLCHAIGENAYTPPNTLNQPELYPRKKPVSV